MESYEREWETGALHWGIDDESVLPLHQYSWGVQRILMGQSVVGTTEHESYDKFRLHLYGPLSAIANYYVRDEPGNPIARFQRVLEAVTSTGALVTYSPAAGKMWESFRFSTRCGVTSTGISIPPPTPTAFHLDAEQVWCFREAARSQKGWMHFLGNWKFRCGKCQFRRRTGKSRPKSHRPLTVRKRRCCYNR
jgi:hypothetical protein